MRQSRAEGFTLVEAIVAIAMLGIISAAIVGTFSLMGRLNQDAATDVDYSRTVRSAAERIKLEWSDPDLFEAMRIGTVDGLTVDEYIKTELGEGCTATATPDSATPDAVRLVRIVCGSDTSTVTQQVFEIEYGRP